MAQDLGEVHAFLGWELEAKQLHLGLIKHHWKPIFRQLNLIQGALGRQCGSPCKDMRFGLVCKLCLNLKAALCWTIYGPQASGLGSQRQQQHPLFATETAVPLFSMCACTHFTCISDLFFPFIGHREKSKEKNFESWNWMIELEWTRRNWGVKVTFLLTIQEIAIFTQLSRANDGKKWTRSSARA